VPLFVVVVVVWWCFYGRKKRKELSLCFEFSSYVDKKCNPITGLDKP
jgi:hypothetical protein